MKLTTTKVVPAEHAASGAVVILWVLGGVLWFASWFGSYIPIAVGPAAWESVLLGPMVWPAWSGEAMLYSLGYQVVSSVLQWGAWARWRASHDGGWLFIYLLTLLVSGVPSFLTYWGAASAELTQAVGSDLGAMMVLALAVLFGDFLPEKIFLK